MKVFSDRLSQYVLHHIAKNDYTYVDKEGTNRYSWKVKGKQQIFLYKILGNVDGINDQF